jgi:hypothetical protein
MSLCQAIRASERLAATPVSRDPGAPRPAGRWRPAAWLRELAVLVAVYVAYEFGRLFADQSLAPARVRAIDLRRVEGVLDLDIEHRVNGWITGHSLWEVAAAYWYSVAHYVVTPLVLVWLWRRRREHYRLLRSTLIGATFVALVVFVLFPTAPPRMLPGYADTLARTAWAGWWSGNGSVPRGLGSAANELAAMPSMHVGWALWVAISVVVATRGRWRHLAWLYPLTTAAVVVATANHWLLDAVAGAAIVAMAFVACSMVGRRRGRAADEPRTWVRAG